MHIDVIEGIEAFRDLKDNWESVYGADPESQFFLSWTWFSRWLDGRNKWFILAAKPEAGSPDYVAFFPLAVKTMMKGRIGFYNHITVAGGGYADYTGFICLPEFDDRALPAFAAHLKTLRWAKLNLVNMCVSHERVFHLLEHFLGEDFDVKETNAIVEDGIDFCKSPYLDLPADWDSFLGGLGKNTRQKARRFLRKVENSEDLRITLPTADTIQRDIETLLTLWTTKWGEQKGDKLNGILQNNRIMLLHCFNTGTLFLPTFWSGDKPYAVLGSLIDWQKKSLRFMIGGRDESFNNPPPGFVLHAYSIRYAISEGLTHYDFLRGDEPYKYSFGAQTRQMKDYVVRTADRRNLGGKLDVRSLSVVFRRSFRFHEKGENEKAEAGFRQILDADPEHTRALDVLGQLLAGMGDHSGAAGMFRTLVGVDPKRHKAWSRLGRALAAGQDYPGAADAFREVIELEPDFPLAHKRLGDALLRGGQVEEAVAVYETAIGQSESGSDKQNDWGETVRLLGRLPPDDGAHAPSIAKLGDIFRERGATALAIDCYQRAIVMNPGLMSAQHGLGLAQTLQGQRDIDAAVRSAIGSASF